MQWQCHEGRLLYGRMESGKISSKLLIQRSLFSRFEKGAMKECLHIRLKRLAAWVFQSQLATRG
jgi:hypothetical protein